MAHQLPAEFQQVASICTATEIEIGGEIVTGIADHRDLHAGLGVKTRHTQWIQRRIADLALQENIDFSVFSQKWEDRPPTLIYRLTLDAAKRIAMAENTPTGHLVQRYFLWCEKRALAPAPALPDDIMSDPFIQLRMKQMEMERRQKAIEAEQRRQALLREEDDFRMRRLEHEAGIDSTRDTARVFLQKRGLKADRGTVGSFGHACRKATIALGMDPKEIPQVQEGSTLARLWPKDALWAAYHQKFGGDTAIPATAPSSAQAQ